MKSITILLSMLCGMTSFAQIPNASFENWETRTLFGVQYEDPAGWYTQNFSLLMEGLSAGCTPTTDAHSGTKALKLSNLENPYFAPAYATTMNIQGTEFNEKFPIVGLKPYQLKGFYKYMYDANEKDTFTINVMLYKNGLNIGYGFISSDSLTTTYTEFTVPIEYFGSDTSVAPDSASISFDISQTKDSILHTSVVMYIDDLSFIGNITTSLTDAVQKPKLEASVFPNPAKTRASIHFEQKSQGIASIEVFDITGKKMDTLYFDRNSSAGKHEVDWITENMERGIYFLLIEAADALKVVRVALD